MRVLVTGGSGFIGSHIVDALMERGFDVRVLDVLHPAAHDGPPADQRTDVDVRRVDLRDRDAVIDALGGVDAVCHQASMVGLGVDFGDVEDYVAHNDQGTATLLGAMHAAHVPERVVLASSMVVYGEGRYRCAAHGLVRPGPRDRERLEAGLWEPPCPECGADLTPESVPEDAPADPRNVYAATKLHQEHLCAAFSREHGVPLTVLRYHNVYGPRMPRNTPYAGVASRFRSAYENGMAPSVFEDGGQRRDFVHVQDVAAANVAALTAAEPRDSVCNVASGTPRTVLDMAEALHVVFPDAPPPQVVGGYRPGDVRHVFASTDRAAEIIGFRASVMFEDGMREFAAAPMRFGERSSDQ
ncbi:MAG: NAD-dependent epimerase/dehydratase family protein [Acidimicrobiia bacterium]|nr:NAD-dependent epimerase/dehydratase family protein [Acidimicrobiia bacterium]